MRLYGEVLEIIFVFWPMDKEQQNNIQKNLLSPDPKNQSNKILKKPGSGFIAQRKNQYPLIRWRAFKFVPIDAQARLLRLYKVFR